MREYRLIERWVMRESTVPINIMVQFMDDDYFFHIYLFYSNVHCPPDGF